MAVGSDSPSSSKYINAEFKIIDINSIKLLKDQSDLVYDGTRIKWMRDFPSLVNFVKSTIGLSGRWKSSGGKAKLFTDVNTDFIITWYPGKLNSLTFNGKKGELLKTFLVSVLNTNCVDQIKVTDSDCLLQTNANESDQSRPQVGCFSPTQEQPIADGTGKVFIDVDSAQPDRSTLNELQDFIEHAFQNISLPTRNTNVNSPYLQSIYSSTPSRPLFDAHPGITEEQFCTFKEKFESEMAILRSKLVDQARIINENKQDICKLVGENLHLKSRLAELETNVHSKVLLNTVSEVRSDANTSCGTNSIHPQPDESTKIDQLPVVPLTQANGNSSPTDEYVNLQTDGLSQTNLPPGISLTSPNAESHKSLIIVGTGERNNILLPTLSDRFNATSESSPDLPQLETTNPQPGRSINEPNSKYTLESFPAFKPPVPQLQLENQSIKSKDTNIFSLNHQRATSKSINLPLVELSNPPKKTINTRRAPVNHTDKNNANHALLKNRKKNPFQNLFKTRPPSLLRRPTTDWLNHVHLITTDNSPKNQCPKYQSELRLDPRKPSVFLPLIGPIPHIHLNARVTRTSERTN